MKQKKLNRAEQILGTLFGFKGDHEPNDVNVDKCIDYFKEYVYSIRPPTPKFSKEFLKCVEEIDLKRMEL